MFCLNCETFKFRFKVLNILYVFDLKSDFLNYSVIDSYNLLLDRDIRGLLFWFVVRYDYLEYIYTGFFFFFLVFGIRIKFF